MSTFAIWMALLGIILVLLADRKNISQSLIYLTPALIGLLGALMFSMIYLIKDNHYVNVIARYFWIPRAMLNRIAFLPISGEILIRLVNWSCLLFVFSSVGLGLVIAYPNKTRLRLMILVSICVPVIAQCVMFDPAFYRIIYLRMLARRYSSLALERLWSNIRQYTSAFNILCLLFSLGMIISAYIHTPRFRDLRFNGLLLCLCFSVLVAAYIFMFYWAPYKLIKVSAVAGGLTTVQSMPLMENHALYRAFTILLTCLSPIIMLACYRQASFQKGLKNERTRIIKDIDIASLVVRVFCHYLKNELLAIRSEIELERMAADPEAAPPECLARIDERCAHIFDHLEIIHQESKSQLLHMKRAEMNALLQELAEDLRPLPDGVTLTLSLWPEPVYCMVDGYLFSQAFYNIVKNAQEALCDVPPKRREITVTARVQGQFFLLSVLDYGVGIEKARLKDIFEPFHSSTKNMDHNWGIGLSYTRKIIVAHEGRITADSQEGEYTQIDILLPKVQVVR